MANSRVSVVVADDSSDLRLLLRLRLEQEGYAVLGEASNGMELLELVERAAPDLVLVDVAMPGMDGLEAAALVRERAPGTRIVMLSGYGRDRMERDAARAGADAYVEKGATGEQLFDVLAGLDALPAPRPPATGDRLLTDSPGNDAVGDVEVLYRLMLETLAEGVVVLGADGRLRSANPAAAELFGRSVDVLVGMAWVELGEVTDEGRPATADSSVVMGAVTAGRRLAREIPFARADGSLRWVSTSVRPLLGDTAGRPLRAVVSLLDVTEHRAYERAREVAEALQEAVLPTRLPAVGELDLVADYVPAGRDTEVGGDWYDAVALPDGTVGLVIGDVEGHDVAAAGLMGQIRSVIRGFASEGHPPALVLEHANRYLLGLGVERLVTVALVHVHPAEQLAIVASAGHLPPVLARPGQPSQLLDRHTGPPLGVDAGARWRESTVILPPASTLLLYTDGLVEHSGASLDAAIERLCAAVDRHRDSVHELVADVMAGVGRWSRDDVAVLAARLASAEPPASRVRRRLPARPVSVPIARWFVADLLAGWDVPDEVWETAELLLSEVVTNACRHSEEDIELRVELRGRHVRFSVADTSHRKPVMHDASPDDTSGRGLQLVDMLAADWGIDSGGLGNVVWFDIALSGLELTDALVASSAVPAGT